ncbi:MAG: PAS domain S-box protein [Bacteroidales bacterium]
MKKLTDYVDSSVLRKSGLAVLSGVLCFFLSGLSIKVQLDQVTVNLVWSILFPLVIALAYGSRYGIIAGLSGGAFFPFFLWANNGYANLFNLFLLLALFFMAGKLAFRQLPFSYRFVVKRVLLVMLAFGVLAGAGYLILFNPLLSFNPAFWQKEYITGIDTGILLGFLLKDITNYTFLIFTAELILRIPAARNFFRLPPNPYLIYNSTILSGSLLAALLVWLLLFALEFAFLQRTPTYNQTHTFLALTVIVWSSVFICRVVMSFVEKRLMAEEKARREESYQKAILNSLNVGIGITDLQGNYEIVNHWWPEKLGYSEEELKRKTNIDITHPDDIEPTQRWFKALLDGKINHYRLEKRFVRKDGSSFWADLTVSALKNEKGDIERIVGVINDISERMQLQQDLQFEKMFSQRILEALPGIFYLYSYPDLKLKMWNHSHETLLGFSSEEMKDRLLTDWYAPEAAEFALEAVHKAINTGFGIIEAPLFDKKGKARYFLLTGTRLEVNQQTYLLGYGMDISDRIKAEKQIKYNQERQNAMIAHIADVIAILDSEGIIRYKSPNIEKWFGWKPSDMIGRHTWDLIHPEDKPRVANFFERIVEKKELSDVIECRYLCADGSYKWIEACATHCLNYPEIQGVLVNYRDISERKKAIELEKEVVVARRSAEFKQKFLANMSHEIRTPLTGVLGMAEVLLSTSLDDQQKDYVYTLMQSGDNLKQIINLILDYSKIEAGQVTLKQEVFRTGDLCRDAEVFFRMINRKPIEFCCNTDEQLPENIIADKQKLDQVMRNLISNAVKFTSEGSIRVRIKIDNPNLQPPNGNRLYSDQVWVRVEVEDTGCGISFEKQAQVFNPFYQIDDEYSRHAEGTGLGLAICRELVHFMGGEIGVKSYPDKGTQFWFYFPASISLAAGQKENQDHKNIAVGISRPLHILLVEDKLINQKVISLLLGSVGHKLDVTSNGKEALQKFVPGRYDLVLMDIQMPVMDGVEATQRLRDMHENLPPIVGLSANAFEGDKEKYMGLGLDHYLTKPVNLKEFNQLMAQLNLY